LWGHEWAAVAWMQSAILELQTQVERHLPDCVLVDESIIRTDIAEWFASSEHYLSEWALKRSEFIDD
jgi:hypothetical protein